MPHTHDSADSVDDALEGNRQGVQAVLVSFGVLLGTAGLQALVVL